MEDAGAGVGLLSPDKACLVPVCYKKNSLAVKGLIRQVRLHEDEQPENVIEEKDMAIDDTEYCLVQTMVKVKDEMMERPSFRGWRTDTEGRPFRFRRQCREFQDPSFHFEWRQWPLRSTLIKDEKDDKNFVRTIGLWLLEKAILQSVVLHRRQEGVQALGEVIGESHQLTEGDLVKKADTGDIEFAFRKEPAVPMEIILFPVPKRSDTA